MLTLKIKHKHKHIINHPKCIYNHQASHTIIPTSGADLYFQIFMYFLCSLLFFLSATQTRAAELRGTEEKHTKLLRESVDSLLHLKTDLQKAYNRVHKAATTATHTLATAHEAESDVGTVNEDHCVHTIHVVKTDTVACGSGMKVSHTLEMNTCRLNNTVAINSWTTDGVRHNASVIRVNQTDCDTTECVVDSFFVNQTEYTPEFFGYNRCVIYNIASNEPSEFMSNAPIELMCDSRFLFGKTSFASECHSVNVCKRNGGSLIT